MVDQAIVYRDKLYRDLYSRDGLDQLRAMWEATGWCGQFGERSNKDWMTVLQRSDYVISAWHDRTLVGFVRAFTDGALFVFICDVVVAPGYRRQGIGRELMLLLKQQLSKRKWAGVHLFRWDGDPANKAFYEGLNFHDCPGGMEWTELMSPE